LKITHDGQGFEQTQSYVSNVARNYFKPFPMAIDNKLFLLLSTDIVAFKEEFYELIDDVDAPPKQEQQLETEASNADTSEEKQKGADN